MANGIEGAGDTGARLGAQSQKMYLTRMKAATHAPSLDALDAESKYLVHKAKEAAHYAYAPYSRFMVGAALILADGTVVTGSNQENASYPVCMCAERVALYVASAVYPGQVIQKLAVVAHKKNHKELTPAVCCGACAQVILEYEMRQGQPIEIIVLAGENNWMKCPSVATLLPFGFSKQHLE